MTDSERQNKILDAIIRVTYPVRAGGLTWKRMQLDPWFDADVGDEHEMSLRYVHRYLLPDYLLLFRRRSSTEENPFTFKHHRIATGGLMLKRLWNTIKLNRAFLQRKEDQIRANAEWAAEDRLLELLKGW